MGQPSTTAEGGGFVEIAFDAGRKGAWTGTVNRPLVADAQYVERRTGYRYRTDESGRVSLITGILQNVRGDRNSYQQAKAGRDDRLGTDDGGHLIATVFRGPGERINLVPMDFNLNRGAWKAMENQWARALDAGGTVHVKIKVLYDGDSHRPKRFQVTYRINDETPFTQRFRNAPGGV